MLQQMSTAAPLDESGGPVARLDEPHTIRFVRPKVDEHGQPVCNEEGRPLQVPLRGQELANVAMAANDSDSDTDRLIGSWLLAVESPNTRDAYAFDLERWTRWLACHHRSVLQARRGDVLAWCEHLRTRPEDDPPGAPTDEPDDLDEHGRPRQKRPLRGSTIRRRVAAVSSFYRHLIDEAVTDYNPAQHVPVTDDGEGTPALSEDEAGQLLAAARDAGPVEEALVGLLYWNGLRVSEVVGLRGDDPQVVDGVAALRIRLKGRKAAFVPLADRLADLVDWLADHGGPALLTGDDGQPLSRHQAARRVERLGWAAVGKRVTPHMLRASCATHLLNAGVPLRDVQVLLNHADPGTTMLYDRHSSRVLARSPTHLLADAVDEAHR